MLGDPSLAPLLHWAPIVCWTVGGAMLLALTVGRLRQVATAAPRAD
jgi:hypothetical protein